MATYNWKWEDLGRSIQDVVDRAVKSSDFQRLNQQILKTVSSVAASQSYSGANKKIYSNTVFKSIKAVVKIFCGFWLAIIMLVFMFAATLDGEPVFYHFSLVLLFGIPLVAGIYLMWNGVQNLQLISRFKRYCRILGNSTYCAVETFVAQTGKSAEFVRRDLQKMIRKDFFLEGHFNKEQSHFLTSNESFQYYEQSRIELEKARKEKEKTTPITAAAQDTQVQEILDRGNSYIAQIRQCNDDIPGELISEKISRIELLVQRIFERVKANPEIVPDLKKLMEYYLPMTVKLLKAYADMDKQPVQGETIRSAKREIEDTLDTINLAFEKLLDDLFAETAMDVSSDISVLHTLLAQEGLASDELSKLKEQSQT